MPALALPSLARRSASVLTLSAAAVLLGACASTSYRTALAGADRPGYTFGTATVPKGGVQAEVGYTDTRVGALTYRTLGEGLLRVGAGPTTELRLTTNSYALKRDAGQRADGMEDAKLGLKQRLWAGGGTSGTGSSTIALLAGTSVPTGSDGFGVAAWQPEAIIAAVVPVNGMLSFVANVGDVYAQLGEGRRRHRLLGSVASWVTVSPRWSAFGEYSGSRYADVAGSALHYVDGGVAFAPVPAIQLDVRLGKGLNGLANDRFVGVGISRRW